MFDEQPGGDPHGECALEIKTLQARIAELEAELDRMRSNYENACKLVAQMHYETTGSHIGPRLGVVQDVAALRAERDALKVERDEWAAKWHAMRRQYGEMRWPGMTRVVTASDAAMNQPKESGQ